VSVPPRPAELAKADVELLTSLRDRMLLRLVDVEERARRESTLRYQRLVALLENRIRVASDVPGR
jgi:hypothetical protein